MQTILLIIIGGASALACLAGPALATSSEQVEFSFLIGALGLGTVVILGLGSVLMKPGERQAASAKPLSADHIAGAVSSGASCLMMVLGACVLVAAMIVATYLHTAF